MSYLRVCEDLNGEPVELPAEDDDTLPVSTLQAQFPNAIGLKYLPDPDCSIFRGIRCIEGKLKPPKEGWDELTLYCVFPPDSKRKGEDQSTDAPSNKKVRTSREVKCSDLIVLGLNFSTTNESLKEYFEEKFGPVLMSLVKVDINTKRSKGFGFVRFSKYEDQVKALSARKHEIDGRWVTIKPPFAKEGVESALPSKVFISRLSASMTKEELEEYFVKYGEIADVFLPRPFRGFAFITYVTPESADQACDEEPHIIKGVSVSVVRASEQQKKDKYGGGGYSKSGRGGSGGGYYSGYSAPRDRFSYGGGSSRYSSRSGSYGNSYSRDNYDDYSRNNDFSRDDYGGYGGSSGGGGNNAASEITKALAAALSNPATVSSLLNNLGNKGGQGHDYNSRDYPPNNDYKDNYYSKERSYNPYNTDDNYGGSSGGKYSGGSGGSLRY